eukprot:scaffold9241_cov135-Skeletonema_marinoi.AAC.8
MNSARTASNSQQRTSCTPINYSSTSTSKSSSVCNNNNIEVSIINSNNDILSLADMRFQEWMADDPNPPSIHNFRMATAEIYQERKIDGAIVFLAKKNNDNNNNNDADGNSSVGAAELSPIELKDVIVLPNNIDNEQQQQRNKVDNTSSNLLRYVTDVVTSFSSRRLGVGSILMDAVEKSAWDLGTRCLLLHVEDENDMARRFYEKLNYVYVGKEHAAATTTTTLLVDSSDRVSSLNLEETIGHTINIDTTRLAVNAGTTGQLLMMKELSEPVVLQGEERANDASREVIKGFGRQTMKRDKKKKKTP